MALAAFTVRRSRWGKLYFSGGKYRGIKCVS